MLDAVNDRFGLGVEIIQREIGLAPHAATGSTLPDEVLSLIPAVDGVLLYDYPPRSEGGPAYSEAAQL